MTGRYRSLCRYVPNRRSPHTAAAVCGPSRYGLLTGRYPWRRGKGGTSNGAKFRDLYVEDGRLTLASLLKQKKYNTAQLGKWGLRHNYSDAVHPGREPGDLDAYDFENIKCIKLDTKSPSQIKKVQKVNNVEIVGSK